MVPHGAGGRLCIAPSDGLENYAVLPIVSSDCGRCQGQLLHGLPLIVATDVVHLFVHPDHQGVFGAIRQHQMEGFVCSREGLIIIYDVLYGLERELQLCQLLWIPHTKNINF